MDGHRDRTCQDPWHEKGGKNSREDQDKCHLCPVRDSEGKFASRNGSVGRSVNLLQRFETNLLYVLFLSHVALSAVEVSLGT